MALIQDHILKGNWLSVFSGPVKLRKIKFTTQSPLLSKTISSSGCFHIGILKNLFFCFKYIFTPLQKIYNPFAAETHAEQIRRSCFGSRKHFYLFQKFLVSVHQKPALFVFFTKEKHLDIHLFFGKRNSLCQSFCGLYLKLLHRILSHSSSHPLLCNTSIIHKSCPSNNIIFQKHLQNPHFLVQ